MSRKPLAIASLQPPDFAAVQIIKQRGINQIVLLEVRENDGTDVYLAYPWQRWSTSQ